jgi:outer membrane protein insertion porin family
MLRRVPFLLLALLASLLTLPAGAARAQSFTVDSLRVTGERFVPAERILLEFGVARGDTLDRDQLGEAVKRLYRSHRFETLAVRAAPLGPSGVLLELQVSEFPRVAELRWEGLKKLKKKDLEDAIRITQGSYLRPLLVEQARASILAHAEEKGYYSASVEADEAVQNGRATLTFTVNEGAKTKIHAIRFEGNSGLSDGDLKDAVSSKPKRLYLPLTWGNFNAYQPDSIAADVASITRAYHQAGYLDARVLETKRDFDEENADVTITYRVEEGARYAFGSIDWSGNVALADSTLAEFLPFEAGEPFDGWALDRGVAKVSEALYDRGYLYNQVRPERKLHDRRVDLSLRIVEGPLARVREIIVAGNDKTLDKVIRREVKIFPGELFNREKVIRSHRDIFMLRFFDDVQFEPRTDPASGDVDLVFRVLERSTGNFGAGVTYSEATSVTGFIQVGAQNFRGRGESLNFQWEFGSRVNLFNVGFTEPWFRDRPISLSGNIYRSRSDLYREYYKDEKVGFSVGAGRPFPWLEYSRISATYRLESIKLFDFSQEYLDAGGRLAERDWPEVESSVTLLFLRDSTDNPFLPTRGTRFRVSSQFAGGALGGNLLYQKYLSNYTWYQKLTGPFVLRFHQTLGLVDGLDRPDQVPDQERFRLGGNRTEPLRGYDDYSVVPYRNSGVLGGRAMTTGTVEVVLGVNNSVQIVAPFFDFGNTWNSMSEADFTTLKRSIGFGARIEIPLMGVLGFDWGYPLDPEPGSDHGRFHFKMGTDF